MTIKGLGFTREEVAEEMNITGAYFSKLLNQAPLDDHYKALAYQAVKTLINERREQQEKFLEWLNSSDELLTKYDNLQADAYRNANHKRQDKMQKTLDEIAYYLSQESRRNLDDK